MILLIYIILLILVSVVKYVFFKISNQVTCKNVYDNARTKFKPIIVCL